MNERMSMGELPDGLLGSLRNVDTWLRKSALDAGLRSLIFDADEVGLSLVDGG